ncbi:MAG: carbonic anhydrase family protein [Planctomycetes bacterium]|nr:carbonic anhydrase family protein [Planctomycetota bacterium]
MDRRLLAVRRSALRLSVFSIACVASFGCATGPSPRTGAGAGHDAVLATEGSLDNAVHGSAPDAVASVEQGYALASCTHGLRQSPIDIFTKAVVPGDHAMASHYEPSHGHIRNLGHTIQLDYDSGSYVEFEGRRYDVAQFHFHTPSEHRIDGMTFPMELHLVHKQSDDVGEVPHFLVVGVLYKCGDEDPLLARFLDAVPGGDHEEVDLADLQIAIGEALGDELQRYYHYTGSLTTPPFTETVQWLVLQHVFEASPQQIERMNRLEGNNARHVQALQGRVVDSQGSTP